MNILKKIFNFINPVFENEIFKSVAASGLVYLISGLFKAKGLDQKASERKNKLYVPLKTEINSLMSLKINFSEKFDKIKCPMLYDIVDNADQYALDKKLFNKCVQLLNLITEFNRINTKKIVSNLFIKRFITIFGKDSIRFEIKIYNEELDKIQETYEYHPIFNHIESQFRSNVLIDMFLKELINNIYSELFEAELENRIKRIFKLCNNSLDYDDSYSNEDNYSNEEIDEFIDEYLFGL